LTPFSSQKLPKGVENPDPAFYLLGVTPAYKKLNLKPVMYRRRTMHKRFDRLISASTFYQQRWTSSAERLVLTELYVQIRRLVSTRFKFLNIVRHGHEDDFVQVCLLKLWQSYIPRLRSVEWSEDQFVCYCLKKVSLMATDYFHSKIEKLEGSLTSADVEDLLDWLTPQWCTSGASYTPEYEFVGTELLEAIQAEVDKLPAEMSRVADVCLIKGEPPRSLGINLREAHRLKSRTIYRLKVNLRLRGINGNYFRKEA